MTLEDRLRHMAIALPKEASIMLSEGTVRAWIRSGKLEAYWLGSEYRITRSAVAMFRDRRRDRPMPPEPADSPSTASTDLAAWRKVREANG